MSRSSTRDKLWEDRKAWSAGGAPRPSQFLAFGWYMSSVTVTRCMLVKRICMEVAGIDLLQSGFRGGIQPKKDTEEITAK